MLIVHQSTRHNIQQDENFQQRRVENSKRQSSFCSQKITTGTHTLPDGTIPDLLIIVL